MSSALLDACLHWHPLDQSSISSSSSSGGDGAGGAGGAGGEALDADEGFGQTILVTDEIATPGSFLLYHFLGRFLRNRPAHSDTWRCVLVGHADVYRSYHGAARRLGLNLDAAMQKRRFDYVDANSITTARIVPQEFTLPRPGEADWVSTLVETIAVRSGVADGCRPCIVIDDISHPMCVGAAVGDVLTYVCAVRALVERHNGILVVLAHHDLGSQPLGTPREPADGSSSHAEVAVDRLLMDPLRRMAHIILQVEPLGATHGVDGQVSLIRGPRLLAVHGFSAGARPAATKAVHDVGIDEFGPGNTVRSSRRRLLKAAREIKPVVIHYRLTETSVKMALRGFSHGLL